MEHSFARKLDSAAAASLSKVNHRINYHRFTNKGAFMVGSGSCSEDADGEDSDPNQPGPSKGKRKNRSNHKKGPSPKKK